MFALGAAPAILFAIAITFSKESPRWLMKVGRENEAERVLDAINGPSAAAEESSAIRASLAQEEGHLSELFRGPFRKALLIGFVLAALTQASGITSVLSFLPEVFKSAGQTSADAFRQAVLVGAVNVVFTMVAIWLVDKAGRRSLILFGTAVQTISLAAVGVLYMHAGHSLGVLAGIMAFVSGHAVGNGAVCWVIISEIFPNKVRGAAMSMATVALWASAYLANLFFPMMQRHFGSHGTFFFFAVMAAIDFVFVLLVVPETKGFSLEEISGMWAKGAKPVLSRGSTL